MHVPVLNQPSPCCHGAPRSDKQVADSDQQSRKRKAMQLKGKGVAVVRPHPAFLKCWISIMFMMGSNRSDHPDP
jgi:hypothetical protein